MELLLGDDNRYDKLFNDCLASPTFYEYTYNSMYPNHILDNDDPIVMNQIRKFIAGLQ